ncbi:MAG: NFACT family protein, partial [Clostridia bacterium]|nr:NFACT family protein [Clostridia bacterium]
MAFDGFFCLAVAEELRSWTGAKVEKIHQSAPSCLYLCLYREGKHANLILSVSASRPMLAVTEEEIARPNEPTALCMLFRKHLQNGRLLAVDCVPNERIVCFRFESADELGFLHEKRIYAEMMGKYSNLILVGENGAVLAATTTADLTASVRQVMPGMPYELPPAQDKRDALQTDRETFLRLVLESSGKRADQFLVQSFFSFSPAIAREVSFRAFERTDEILTELSAGPLWTSFDSFANSVRDRDFTPNAVYDGENGVEYAFLPLTQYSGLEVRPYGSFSELQIRFFARREETVNIRSYASDILKKLKTLLAREQKKAGLLREEMNACAEREVFRKHGDLLTANLYRLKPGIPEAEVEDYETGDIVRIPMNIRLTPTQNAQAYYRRYAKMKRAEEALRGQIA